MNPQFEDETPVNPFDLWEGANFRLKIRQFEGYPNYDKSEFDAPSPLSDDDSELETIYNQEHSLQELLDPKNFKSYAELKTKLYRVLDLGEAAGPSAPSAYDDEDDGLDLSATPSFAKTAPAVEEDSIPFEPAPTGSSSTVDDDDDDLSIFKELAKG